MNRTPFRRAARRLALCAAIVATGVSSTVVFAEDQVTPDPSQSASIDSENFYDAEFDEHVDLRLFGVAFSSLDAKLMTDVALQLREAETVLGRKHKMISSKQMLKFATKMAAEGKDTATLDRLILVAKASDDKSGVEEIEQLKSLTADARDLRDEAMFSATDVERGALAAFANLTLQIRAAELSGDSETLESLKKAIDKLQSLREPQKNKLYGLVDNAQDLLGDSDPDETSDLLRALTGASRDFYPGSPPPGTQAAVVNQQTSRTAIIVNPNVNPNVNPTPPFGASPQVSYATGGMRYLPSPAGAIVQSHGRLGSILFEPGDVITSIGGIPVSYGQPLDNAINSSYLTSNRIVVVRDRNSGRVLTLYF